ncbi:MAG: hypothetical protein H7X95_03480 [Deltaproteobacteria bacterium]|nr:hypothetical protein [Deltaproteobacteria bacterium]
MKPEQITEALEQAAGQVGVSVRYETMTGDSAGAGGLCKIRGEWTVIMDRKATPSDRAAMLVDALSEFDVDAIYLPPEIRQVLAKRRAAHQAAIAVNTPGDAAAT